MKKCPRLEKYHILNGKIRLEDWGKAVCEDCVLDVCIYDRPGKLIRLDAERLEASTIGCPKCQSDPIVREEIKRGDRLSGLRPDEDGWKCFICGYIIYAYKPRKKKEV